MGQNDSKQIIGYCGNVYTVGILRLEPLHESANVCHRQFLLFPVPNEQRQQGQGLVPGFLVMKLQILI